MPPTAWIGSRQRVDDRRRRAPAGRASARFSAIVLPVTVRQSPWSRPASSSSLHHDRHAADAVEVDHVVLAVRLRVGDVRHPGRDPVEVVELELDPGLVRRWRAGAARRWSSRRAPSTTAMAFSNASLVMIWRGRMPELEQAHDRLARLVGEVVAAAVDGGRRRRCRAATCRCASADRRHRVGGEHAGARALGRAGVALDLRRARPRSMRAGGVRADRLEHADDVERLAVVAGRAGSSRRRGTPTAG